ncbi:MAG: SH3 domain-containing protein [Methylophilaceae bacterium]|nr:SH3 domain-containing protein [Methylophilaceae bacterium]
MRHDLFLLGALLATTAAWAGEPGTALKNDSLRAEPYGDAKAVGSLNRGDKVDILAKQGAWLQVKAGKTTGWVRLLSIKRGSSSGGSEAAGVLALASGRAGTGQVVSTTGVRGLNEEALKSAKFNDADIQLLDTSAVSADDARQFAATGGLAARRLDYLPEPKGGAQ